MADEVPIFPHKIPFFVREVEQPDRMVAFGKELLWERAGLRGPRRKILEPRSTVLESVLWPQGPMCGGRAGEGTSECCKARPPARSAMTKVLKHHMLTRKPAKPSSQSPKGSEF